MRFIRSKNRRVQRTAKILAGTISVLVVVFSVLDMVGHRPRLVEILTVAAGGIGAIFSVISLRKRQRPGMSTTD